MAAGPDRRSSSRAAASFTARSTAGQAAAGRPRPGAAGLPAAVGQGGAGAALGDGLVCGAGVLRQTGRCRRWWHRSASASRPPGSASRSCTTPTIRRLRASRWVNRVMALSLDLIGGSSYVWSAKHLAHHTYPNVTEHDPDIDSLPFARFDPAQHRRPWHRYQHIYIWALYGMVTVRWQFMSDFAFLRKGRRRPQPYCARRGAGRWRR